MRGLCNAVARGKKIEIRKWKMENGSEEGHDVSRPYVR
jgi:hypothetical protein